MRAHATIGRPFDVLVTGTSVVRTSSPSSRSITVPRVFALSGASAFACFALAFAGFVGLGVVGVAFAFAGFGFAFPFAGFVFAFAFVAFAFAAFAVAFAGFAALD